MTDKIKDIINNFSDMKIIKALECCIIGDCDNCSFYETRELCPNLFLFVSDLIKRQEAEIEMDDVEIKELRIALQGYLDDLTKERNLYKKSIEELNQAKAENERLKTNLNIELENYATEYDNKIKSEAYREFAEKINAEAEKVEIDREGDFVEAGNKIYYTVADWCNATSDNLLKELVGDDDG